MLQDWSANLWNLIGRENLSTTDSLGGLLQSTVWCQFNRYHRWLCDAKLSLMYILVDNRQFVSNAMPIYVHHTNCTLRYADARTKNRLRRVQVTITTTWSCALIMVTYHNFNRFGRRSRLRLNDCAYGYSKRTLETVVLEMMIIMPCHDVMRIGVVHFNNVVVFLVDSFRHGLSSVVGAGWLQRLFVWGLVSSHTARAVIQLWFVGRRRWSGMRVFVRFYPWRHFMYDTSLTEWEGLCFRYQLARCRWW